jgi:hypothetical protein
MYILASVFFSKKTIKTYLKLEIRVACREFIAFRYVVIVFFETKQMIIYIFTSEILKTRVLNRFFGTQYSFVFLLGGRG